MITGLHETMGNDDFLELYTMEVDEEDKAFLSNQAWVGLGEDGKTHQASMVTENPESD